MCSSDLGSNYMAWKNLKADEFYDKAQVELDPGKRAKLVQGAIDEFMTDLPQLPLYYRADVMIAPAQLNAHQDGNVGYPTALRVERWTWDETAAH